MVDHWITGFNSGTDIIVLGGFPFKHFYSLAGEADSEILWLGVDNVLSGF